MKHFAQSYFKKLRNKKVNISSQTIQTHKDFSKVIIDFNSILATSAVENRKQEIPKIGRIGIFKKIPHMVNRQSVDFPGFAIDFNKSKQEQKTVYHLNSHSDGCVMVVEWSPSLSLIGDIKAGWFFKAARNLTRKKLAPKIKSGFTDYPITKRSK